MGSHPTTRRLFSQSLTAGLNEEAGLLSKQSLATTSFSWFASFQALKLKSLACILPYGSDVDSIPKLA